MGLNYMYMLHTYFIVFQFQSLGPAQREAIMRALNDDSQKLIAEYPPNAAEVGRLRAEMRNCNEVYDELMARIDREPTPGANRELLDFLEQVKVDLSGLDRELSSRMQQGLPRDLHEADDIMRRHRVSDNTSLLLVCLIINIV